MSKQLPLPFVERPLYLAADFINAPSNEPARVWLENPEGWSSGRMVLWGEAGHGKTHLARIWAAARQAAWFDGADLWNFAAPPAPAGPVVIDDANAANETTLFHFLNAAAQTGCAVLLTSRLPPARQKFKLPDLASRLRASQAVEISAPDDDLLATLLARLAADRQLVLNFQVRNYLLSHLPRTPTALREAVARLDAAALATGGKITRGMAAELVAAPPPGSPDPHG